MATAHSGRFVSYLRVSTTKQGADGNGIAAQRERVQSFLNGGDWSLIAEYVEVQSGRKGDRPQLAAALDHCRRERAELVVAKLDRLSRDTRHFLQTLDDAGVVVRFADVPDVKVNDPSGRLHLSMLIAFAEFESRRIGERTKEGMAAAKRKGSVFGVKGRENVGATVAARKAKAVADAIRVRGMIEGLQARRTEKGKPLSLRTMAAELNTAKIPAPRGGEWRISTLARVIARLDAMKPPPPKRGPGRPRKITAASKGSMP